MAQQAAEDHPHQVAAVVEDRPVQAAVAAGELLGGLAGGAQDVFDLVRHLGRVVLEALGGEDFREVIGLGQVQAQVQGMHVGHAGEEAGVQVGGDQQLVVDPIELGLERRDHRPGGHAADLDGLQHGIGGGTDLPHHVIGGSGEHHLVIVLADQRHHVDAHGIGDVGGELVMLGRIAVRGRARIAQEQLGDPRVVMEDFGDLVLDDLGGLLQPDPHVAVEDFRQGSGRQFRGDHGGNHTDQPERQHQLALQAPAGNGEGARRATIFSGHVLSLIAAAMAGSERSGRTKRFISLSRALSKGLRCRKNNMLPVNWQPRRNLLA